MKLKILNSVWKIVFVITFGLITCQFAVAQPTPIPTINTFTYTYDGNTYSYSGLNCSYSGYNCNGWSSDAPSNSSDFLTLFIRALQNGGFASMVSPAGCSNYLSIRLHYRCRARYCWGHDIYQQSDDPNSLSCLATHVMTCPVGCRDGECYSERPNITCSVQNMGPSSTPGHFRIKWSANIIASSPTNSRCVDAASCCPNLDPALPQPCRLNWMIPGDDNIYGSGNNYVFDLATAGNTYTRTVRLLYYGTYMQESCSITIPPITPTPAPTTPVTPSVVISKNAILIQ